MSVIFNKNIDSYLSEIINTPTPSGFEAEGQTLFTSYAKQYVDDVYTDVLGNVIAHKKAEGKPKLMLTAHIDEVGFMVKYIDENGMLYVVPIGGIDQMLLPGTRLAVHHNGNAYMGVIGRKPIHLLNEMERHKFTLEDGWLDMGFNSKEHAQLSIAIGDPITFSTELSQISDDYIMTRSADNKIGGVILLDLMRRLKEIESKYDLYFVSTVQEEIGLRGSMPVTSALEPDFAIVIDATHSTDYPNTNKKLYGDIALGGGPSFAISPDTNRDLISKLIECASNIGLDYQVDAQPNASGTEARAIQLVRTGTKTGLISFPVRYMHSPSEIVSISDINGCISILLEFCKV